MSNTSAMNIYESTFAPSNTLMQLICDSAKPSIYESTFAPSDKTDAILVVDGIKLHVNKALLSYHSDYFKTLFNSDFAEKSMPEIPIKDVTFKEFATVLSLVHEKPVLPTVNTNFTILLDLADRFLLPAARTYLEVFICSIPMDTLIKLKLADKYKLDILLDNTIETFNTRKCFKGMYKFTLNFSDHTRSKLFQRFFSLCDIPHHDFSSFFR